jgi:hypothetical protein
MRRLIQLVESAELDEMPVVNYQTVGDFDKPTRGFRKPEDRALATSPKAIQKLHKKFANNRFDFNFIIANSPETAKHQEIGVVDRLWLEHNMPKMLPQMQFDSNAINIIYTGNAAAERYPFTPWIIAHRLGHALSPGRERSNYAQNFLLDAQREIRRYATQILELYGVQIETTRTYYNVERLRKSELVLRHFYEQIGTFKSARDKDLREHFEFTFECLAQFLTTGAVKFNKLGRCIRIGTAGWGRAETRCASEHDVEYANRELDDLAEFLTSEFENALDRAVGHIFVI